MLSSFKGLSWMDRSNNHQPSIQSPTKQKAESSPTGLQALASDGPPRPDGSDKYFGMENVVGFGNTCYCNSILQCLYYSKPFRENVVSFPQRSSLPSSSNSDATLLPGSDSRNLSRVSTDPLPGSSGPPGPVARKPSLTPAIKEETKKPRIPVTASLTQGPTFGSNENKDTPEVKKKLALATGPVLNVDQGNHASYGMEESLFSALKDIFESIVAHNSHTGVVSPNRFLDILRRENDMFSGQQHQDAHEFLNYVLNQVIENVEDYHKKHGHKNGNAVTNSTPAKSSGTLTPVNASSAASTVSLTSTSSTGWIHELFEGLLTSETKCLTCENVSRRDEQFLDLSIDLEKNSSVTSCLRNFSASEMLCERNKFHCDSCGGLQEAEKRMKIKRLPKVLALHLKRFKFMENLGRFEKLHYRVLYPYHLRLFNTTDDAEDPDRLYELYAVVVHIGGGPYHGHYVAIVKTEDKGWLLFDDELVEQVDKAFVRNFFGERPGMACAYVLFYQETTFEAVQREMWADEQAAGVAMRAAAEAAKTESAKSKGHTNGTNGYSVRTSMGEHLPNLYPASSSPLPKSEAPTNTTDQHLAGAAAKHPFPPVPSAVKSKKEREKERKAERGDKKDNHISSINRFKNTSRSLRQAPKWLGGKDKERNSTLEENGAIPDLPPLPVTPELPLTDHKKEAPNGVNHGSGADDERSGDDFSPKTEVPPVAESPKVTVPAVVPAEMEESPAAPKEEVAVPQEAEREDKKENSKKEKKEKKEKEKKEKEKEKKDKEKTRHRSSFFGLRKKASVAFHSES